MSHVLAIDLGTSSARAVAFNKAGEIVTMSQSEYPAVLPQEGLMEQDPHVIWEVVLKVCQFPRTITDYFHAHLAF